MDVAPKLTPREQARALDAFAEKFDALPPDREPTCGWADEMAHLCRNQARVLRGQPEQEWVPRWKRQRRTPNDAGQPHDPAPLPAAGIGDNHVADEVLPQPAE